MKLFYQKIIVGKTDKSQQGKGASSVFAPHNGQSSAAAERRPLKRIVRRVRKNFLIERCPEPSLAIVYGPKPHQYISGEVSLTRHSKRPEIQEAIRRARDRGLLIFE